MPQGGVELGESTEQAASRELYEEMGLRVGDTPGYGGANNDPGLKAPLVSKVQPNEEKFCFQIDPGLTLVL